MSRAAGGLVATLLALLLWNSVAGAQELAVSLEPYRTASERGQVGVLRGEAFVEPRTPRGPSTPLAGVAVTALPSASGFLADLEAVKAHARDGAARYLGAAGEVLRIKDAYERALRQASAAGLVFTGVTDGEGRFELARVPAGQWALLGRHELLYARPAKKIPQQERTSRRFLLEPPPSGYRAVTYWLMSVRIEAGGEVRVELHDRNLWFRGVTEEKPQGAIDR